MKIVVGLSGGVDSGTSAYILKKEGHTVFAVSMIVFNTESSRREVEYAKKIANDLGIEHRVVDKTKEFREKVLDRFVFDYKNGRTPNPCAICNREIKFNMLIDIMRELNYDHIATGHYANVVFENGRFSIKKSENVNKDQSYLLYNLTQEQLSKVIFPIANMDKSKTREIAYTFNRDLSKKRDSLDLCFVKDMDYKEFIKRYEYGDDYIEKIARGDLNITKKIGEVIDINGKVLGYHNGIMNFTIGQRKGVNIAAGSKKYVVEINSEENKVVLGDDSDLYSDKFLVDELNCQGIDEIKEFVDSTGEKSLIVNSDSSASLLQMKDDLLL